MPYIVRKNVRYAVGSGSGGNTNSVDLTMAEYLELEKNGQVVEDTTYYITDSDEQLDANVVAFDDTETQLGASDVQEAIEKVATDISELNSNIDELNKDLSALGGFTPIIDETGKITGYKTSVGGADTVFPFRNNNILCAMIFHGKKSAKSCCVVSPDYFSLADNATNKYVQLSYSSGVYNAYSKVSGTWYIADAWEQGTDKFSLTPKTVNANDLLVSWFPPNNDKELSFIAILYE